MRKDLTELVFVLDMSGSMSDLTDDTIGGFNSVIKDQKTKPGEVLVTTYLFNDRQKMLHDREKLENISPMTVGDYRPMGTTALVDTLGTAIKHVAEIHKYSREEDIPEHTIFMITTDGMENASHIYTSDEVKRKIEHEQEKYGWEFIFLAANIDTVETARRYGFREEMSVSYCADSEGTADVYDAINKAVGCRRTGAPMDNSWRERADRNYSKHR